MYSEEDFEEEACISSEPASEAASPGDATQTESHPVPLSDDELDAYLAEEPAPAASSLPALHAGRSSTPLELPCDDDDDAPQEEAAQHVDSLDSTASSSADANTSPGRPTELQKEQHDATFALEESLVIEDSSDNEAVLESRHAINDTVHSTPQHVKEHTAAADATAQPASASPQHHSNSSDVSAAAATSSQRSSMRTSTSRHTHESAAQNRPSVDQELHDLWQAAGMPEAVHSAEQERAAPSMHAAATASGRHSAGSQTAAAAAGAAAEDSTSSHSSSRSTMHRPQSTSPAASNLVSNKGNRLRPASASPVVQRASSTLRQQVQEEPLYSPASSNAMLQRGYNQQQQELNLLPVTEWTVNDVCDWVDGLGLNQYRKKFVHHVIDGRLLLRLNDTLLRTELGIGPLGHRVLLLDSADAVATADLQQAATAALVGTNPEDFQACSNCSSASSAAAILVAGLIALKAGQRGGSGRNSPWLHAAGSPVNTAAAASPQLAPAAGSPAGRRARPFSAPCKGKGRGRSSSPAGGGHGSPSPGALGPAAGRISVYEQRAKILFELGRAQARAAATAGTATEVADVARIAQKEVAMLQGQLADLDHKNKLAVQHAGGSLDSKGIIPWQHVGNGTDAADPHPERIARPWDSSEVELTFQPRISTKSKQLMAGARGSGDGPGGFLERLDYDIRRREAKQKELQTRYYSSIGGGDPAKSAKAAAADLAVLTGFLSQRGWATLTVYSSNGGTSGAGSSSAALTEADYRELDNQLDEVIETYSEELGLGKSDSKASHAILAARGPKKIAAMVSAVRTQQFMDRYHADLSTRGGRLQQLQDNWFKQQLTIGSTTTSTAPGRRAQVPLTPEQKDLAQATRWFTGMGWQDADSDDCDDRLSALVQRARHYKTEAERLHDKERAAAGGGMAAHSASLPHPSINWGSAPWSADGLGPLMQSVLDARKAASDAAAAAKQAAACKPSAVDNALKEANKQAMPAANSDQPSAAHGNNNAAASSAAATLEAAAASGANTLDLSVQLLAGMRWAGLDQLDAASGKAKKLAVYRALRTQQFLAFTATDLVNREAKQRLLLAQFEASRRGKLVSKTELDDFYQRLQADGERRKADLDKARTDKAEREAKALAMVSVGPGFSRRPRPRSAKT